MRVLTATIFVGVVAAGLAHAQVLNPEIVYGRDYTFERMEATRTVHDAEDDGKIRLVSYVWRPLKNDRHEVVLFSHGSTAGLTRSPKEPGDAPPVSVIRFFVSRGYTLVAPMRRGRGESTGTYVEECAVYAGKCTGADQLALTDRSLREALLDSYAVIDQLIVGRLAFRDSKILVAGISRGGFLSLILAGERPALVKGVVNFVGGWHGANERLSAADFQQRIDIQSVRLTRAAKQTRVPSIWIYAARDPFYSENAPRELLRAWREAGGQAEYIFVAEHQLPSGHAIASNAALWERQVDTFLSAIEPAKQ
jgi:pimeloyl-ACP methyl ester carboxylesterase